MRTSLLLILFFALFSSVNAQITFNDYGDDWAISMNSTTAIDINEDGNTDFYINSFEGELCFVPYALLGCFTSSAGDAYNNIETRELTIHEEGDVIKITNDNLFDYIDGDRGSMYSSELGFADGWEDKTKNYIGFAVFLPTHTEVINGWIEVSVDAEAEVLYIHRMAFEKATEVGMSEIIAGDIGEAPVKNFEIEQLDDFTIAPNPILNENVILNYSYEGEESLNISILNADGKLIYQTIGNQNGYVSIPTDQWTPGVYFVQLENTQGAETKKMIKL